MTDAFDPYHKWLGIPPGRRPPNHYEMLGIGLYESDLDVIENASDRRMSHIKTFASGPQAKISQLLLNQLSEARVCLCTEQSRKAYELQLQKQLAASGGVAAASGSVAGTSSSRRATSGGSGLWLGLSMLVASMIVCYLAFTQGWASVNNLLANATNPKPQPQEIADGKHKPDEGDDPESPTDREEPAAVIVEPDPPEPVPNDQPDALTPEMKVPPENVAIPEPAEPTGNPPGVDFYTELDKAFSALSDYDYVTFDQYRMSAKKMASDQRLDTTTVDANLKSLDEIGEAYQAIWQLVDAAVLKLIRNRTLSVPGEGKEKTYRIVTAVAGRLRVEFLVDGKRVKENYLRNANGPPVYKDMPTALATYLATRMIKKNMLADELDLALASRGANFFQSLDFDKLPAEPRTRWSVVDEKWQSTAAGN